MKKEEIIVYAQQEIKSCQSRLATFKEARKLGINVQQVDEHIRREKREIEYHNSVIKILRFRDVTNARVIERNSKRYKIVYRSENLPNKKQKNHYTNHLGNWIYFNKGAWQYYPENYFPIEVYDNKSDELICVMENIVGVLKCLKSIKEVIE